jgi:Fe-S-cluster containining protein
MPDFNRTECACHDCRSFCKSMPGALTPDDLPRIAAFLQMDHDWPEMLKRYFNASPGALVVTHGVLKRVGTIVPARKEDDSCVFFDEQERCRIHPVAPFGCAMFDNHIEPEDGSKKHDYLIQITARAHVEHAPYAIWHRWLTHINRIAPAPEVLRQRMRERQTNDRKETKCR